MKTTIKKNAIWVLLLLFFNFPVYSFTLYCPEHVWVECDAAVDDLTIYGNAYYHDYDGYHDAGTGTAGYFLNDCGVGIIKRKWTVEDENWNLHTCTQHIYVEGDVFQESDITWPESHITLEGCNPDTSPEETGEPTYNYSFCSLIGVNTSDQLFHFGPDCKKLIRTWTIIDWCTYNPDLGYGSNGSWQFTQTIKISNSEEPATNCIEEVIAYSQNCHSKFVEIPSVMTDESACGGFYVITHNSPYADNAGSNASGTYPIGKTQVQFKIEYGCGSQSFCYVDIIVEDNSSPVPYCLQSLITTLMPMDENMDGINESGMVEIWANDFDKGSYHPCNYGPLQISFSEDTDSTSAVFTCADIGENQIRMYVTDPNGNFNYCIVNLVIQNNGGLIENCEPPPPNNISGNIALMDNSPVANAEVILKNMTPKTTYTTYYDTTTVQVVVDSFYNMSGVLIYITDTQNVVLELTDSISVYQENVVMTDESGNYMFENLENSAAYRLTATRDIFPIDKIGMTDTKKLANYLTGNFITQDPRFLIAADIDENGVINYEDYHLLVHYISTGFADIENYNPWVIVNSESALSNIEEACLIDITSLNEPMLNMNFEAILKGELETFIHTPKQDVILRREANIDFKAKVSPNPFYDGFQIETSLLTEGQITLSIMNISGQQMTTMTVLGEIGLNKWSINTNDILQSGIYILKIISDNQVLSQQKLIKI